jgi:hypothetical protein
MKQDAVTTGNNTTRWKQVLRWVSAACATLAMVTVLTPTPIDDVVVNVLKFILDSVCNFF